MILFQRQTILFLVLCFLVAILAGWHTWTVYSEKSPTALSADMWGEYKGQKWVTVSGELIHSETKIIKEPDGNFSAYIPMGVRGEPKNVVVFVSGYTSDMLKEKLVPLLNCGNKVTGYIPSWSHLPDDAGLTNIAPGAVKVELDAEPHLTTPGKFLAAGGMLSSFLLIAWVWGAIAAFIERKRLKATKDDPEEKVDPFRFYTQ